MIAALCVHRDGVYSRFPDCDLYDEQRDAWTFTGVCPVIAHPPCGLWGKLSHFVKSPDACREKALGIFCAGLVVRNGGVLEQPVNSRLFEAAGLPRPGEYSAKGFTLDIDQLWFGHLGRKRTWLFVSRVNRAALPPLPFVLVHAGVRYVEDLSKLQREATPPALADYLHAIASKTWKHTEASA